MDRADIVHDNFLRRVAAGDLPAGNAPSGPLSATGAVSVFRAGCLSRAETVWCRELMLRLALCIPCLIRCSER